MGLVRSTFRSIGEKLVLISTSGPPPGMPQSSTGNPPLTDQAGAAARRNADSGAFNVGMGNVPARARAHRLPAGSFFALDPGTVHDAFVTQPTAVQLSSTGLWTISYVNPADDPRRQSR